MGEEARDADKFPATYRMAPAQQRILWFHGPVILRFRNPGLHFTRVYFREGRGKCCRSSQEDYRKEGNFPWILEYRQVPVGTGMGQNDQRALPVRRRIASGKS